MAKMNEAALMAEVAEEQALAAAEGYVVGAVRADLEAGFRLFIWSRGPLAEWQAVASYAEFQKRSRSRGRCRLRTEWGAR